MSTLSLGSSSDNSMLIYVILEDEAVGNNKEIENKIMKLTEDLDCNISINSSSIDMASIIGQGIEVIVKGREIDTLREISSDIAKFLEDTRVQKVSQME